MRELALFAGAGGGILGGVLLGWRTVCAVECDRYAADVLLARQNDGSLAPFPIWDDVRTFDGRAWRGCVDVVSGGFPCQDISSANPNPKGIDGERSGLWRDYQRIVRDVRPAFVFVENVPAITARGLGRVLGDLAALGYDAEWCVLGADDLGANHHRERLWVLAHATDSNRGRCEGKRVGGLLDIERQALGCDTDGRSCSLSDPARERCRPRSMSKRGEQELTEPGCGGHVPNAAHQGVGRRIACSRAPGGDGRAWPAWPTEPDVGRVAHGVAARVDRLRAIGNGQVPRVAAAAFELLRRRGGW